VGMLLLSLTGIVYFGWFYYQATQLTINLLEKNVYAANQQA